MLDEAFATALRLKTIKGGTIGQKDETMKKTVTRIVLIVGRILIGQVFFLAGINKLTHPARTIELIANHGVPLPEVCCFAAAALEIGGSLTLTFGVRIRWSALALAGFVLVVTSIFHWDLAKEINAHLFRKDLAIAGGLLLAAYSSSTAKRGP